MFEGFQAGSAGVDEADIHFRVGGQGPPVLLLHGYPQTGAMWHLVAPALAETHTVVVPDLRGYGESSKPPGGEGHAEYAKRAMANDQVALMRGLGHWAFAVVGHDRGARVAHRMALDHADAVERLAVLDIAPTRHVLTHVDLALARTYDHWFFLAQENDTPEVLISADPEFWVRRKLDQWSGSRARFDEEAVAEYVRCFSDPTSIQATTEDYRAGATIDLEHDHASYDAGARVGCPLLALWGAEGFVGAAYDVLAVWRDYAADPDLVRGQALPGGHFVPEEAPQETIAALRDFLTGVGPTG